MNVRRLRDALEWRINAIRHRDPLSPATFVSLFGSRRLRPWNPSRTPKRVVVLRSDEIGDTVTTLTLLAAMRSSWPKATLHLVVKPGPATVFHATPTVDRVISWAPVTEGSAPKRQLLTARQAARRFHGRGYDLAVLPRWDFDDSPVRYLAAASRARSVVGFAPVPEREPVWFGDQSELLTDVLARGDEPLRSVGQLRRIAEHLGVPWPERFEPPVGRGLFDETDLSRVDELAGLPSRPGLVVSIGIGARDAKRQWPVAELVETLAGLATGRRLTVLVLGGGVDARRSAELVEALGERGIAGRDLAGLLSLSESAAAISRSELFIGNDSGLQHIASSLDLPTVVITCHPATGSPWSDNAPERFGPWSRSSAILQPAHPIGDCVDECVATQAHCITTVHASEVLLAAQDLLERSAR